ncbi:MAG: hypothetical protein DMG15_16850 [Acidobacteria bacterium]|nr:MAG: hypothetical protein DMG15_16850 [Acidobacteriota bacterium]
MTPMTNLTFTDSMVGQLKTKTIYTTHDISRLLQVNPRSVINWIEQNLLPSYRTPGGHRRVRRDDLLAFLRKHQIPTPASLVEGKFRILIVEDEEEVVTLLKTYLQRQGGYEVAAASNGINALIDVGRIKPDLLILDVMIPGVDGIEVCRRIKDDSAHAYRPEFNVPNFVPTPGLDAHIHTGHSFGCDRLKPLPVLGCTPLDTFGH